MKYLILVGLFLGGCASTNVANLVSPDRFSLNYERSELEGNLDLDGHAYGGALEWDLPQVE